MPEMNGVAGIDRARALQPGLKVLLMSGHADVLDVADVLRIPLLAKPFKVTELRRRIGDTLLMPPVGMSSSNSTSRQLAVSQ
jgi:DNA-binding response OmpR family regulator